MTVKAGQIYEDFNSPSRYVITHMDDRNVSVVNDCGTVNYFNKKSVLCDTFIAEHPTWQEAINSPEFKGEM